MKQKMNIGKIYALIGYLIWIIGFVVMSNFLKKLPEIMKRFDEGQFYIKEFKPYSLPVNIVCFLMTAIFVVAFMIGENTKKQFKTQWIMIAMVAVVPFLLLYLNVFSKRKAILKGMDYYASYGVTSNQYELYLSPVCDVIFLFAFFIVLSAIAYFFGKNETLADVPGKNKSFYVGIAILLITLVMDIILLVSQKKMIEVIFGLSVSGGSDSYFFVPNAFIISIIVLIASLIAFSLYQIYGHKINSTKMSWMILLIYTCCFVVILIKNVKLFQYTNADIEILDGLYGLQGYSSTDEYQYHVCAEGIYDIFNVMLLSGLGLFLFGLFKQIGRKETIN